MRTVGTVTHTYTNIRVHETADVLYVLLGCGTWLLALRKENRPILFMNMVLGRIFEGTGRKLRDRRKNYVTRCLITSAVR
jgi:hypothetical protein